MTLPIVKDLKQNKFFIIIAAISVILFFITKYAGMYGVRLLFEKGQTDFLNQMFMIAPEAPSLTFYIGFAERFVFGPISQFFAFMALVFIGLPYLINMRPLYFGLSVFVFLIITKWEVLFFPPYGDAIGGPFVEAWWLAKNNFNYFKLYHMPDYSQGGPRTYLFSIFPTHVAIWIKLLRQPSLYLPVLHACVFMMISCMVTILREISRKVLNIKSAFLLAVLFLALPLTQSQTEALNMEAPCLFFIMWSVYFLSHRRVLAAAFAATGAVAVKGTGILACGSIALVAFIFLVQKLCIHKKFDLKKFFCCLLMIIVPILKLFSKYFIKDTHTSAGMVGLFKGWPSFQTIHIVRWFAVSLVVYLIFLLIKYKRREKIYYEANIMYLYGTAFFLLMLNFFAVSERYTFNVVPFSTFACVYAACLIIPIKKLQILFLTIIIGLSSFLSYGQLFGSPRDHVLLERSLEYRNDLYLGQEIAKRIQNNYAQFKIGAPMQYAQILGIKELGYVTKDLDVFIYGFPCKYGGIEEFNGLKNLNIYRTVYVGHGNDGNKKFQLVPDYPIGQNDHLLHTINFGNKEAWIFMGGFEIEKLFQSIRIFLYHQQFSKGLNS